MIIRKCETCDIPKPAGAVCQWARAPAPFTMAVCVSCLKWPVMNSLPRQTHNAQSHSFSYMGVGWHPWHRRTSSQPSEVPCKVICYKHTTHLDSTDNPNEFKWPPTLLLSLFCTLPLSLLGIPQVLTSCSDSWIAVWPAHTWLVVSQGWQVPSVFWGIYLYISALPVPVHHPQEVLGADLVSQLLQLSHLWQLMMSPKMHGHIWPLWPSSQRGTQWAQACSTGHEFKKSLILPGLSYSLKGIDLVDSLRVHHLDPLILNSDH